MISGSTATHTMSSIDTPSSSLPSPSTSISSLHPTLLKFIQREFQRVWTIQEAEEERRKGRKGDSSTEEAKSISTEAPSKAKRRTIATTAASPSPNPPPSPPQILLLRSLLHLSCPPDLTFLHITPPLLYNLDQTHSGCASSRDWMEFLERGYDMVKKGKWRQEEVEEKLQGEWRKQMYRDLRRREMEAETTNTAVAPPTPSAYTSWILSLLINTSSTTSFTHIGLSVLYFGREAIELLWELVKDEIITPNGTNHGQLHESDQHTNHILSSHVCYLPCSSLPPSSLLSINSFQSFFTYLQHRGSSLGLLPSKEEDGDATSILDHFVPVQVVEELLEDLRLKWMKLMRRELDDGSLTTAEVEERKQRREGKKEQRRMRKECREASLNAAARSLATPKPLIQSIASSSMVNTEISPPTITEFVSSPLEVSVPDTSSPTANLASLPQVSAPTTTLPMTTSHLSPTQSTFSPIERHLSPTSHKFITTASNDIPPSPIHRHLSPSQKFISSSPETGAIHATSSTTTNTTTNTTTTTLPPSARRTTSTRGTLTNTWRLRHIVEEDSTAVVTSSSSINVISPDTEIEGGVLMDEDDTMQRMSELEEGQDDEEIISPPTATSTISDVTTTTPAVVVVAPLRLPSSSHLTSSFSPLLTTLRSSDGEMLTPSSTRSGMDLTVETMRRAKERPPGVPSLVLVNNAGVMAAGYGYTLRTMHSGVSIASTTASGQRGNLSSGGGSVQQYYHQHHHQHSSGSNGSQAMMGLLSSSSSTEASSTQQTPLMSPHAFVGDGAAGMIKSFTTQQNAINGAPATLARRATGPLPRYKQIHVRAGSDFIGGNGMSYHYPSMTNRVPPPADMNNGIVPSLPLHVLKARQNVMPGLSSFSSTAGSQYQTQRGGAGAVSQMHVHQQTPTHNSSAFSTQRMMGSFSVFSPTASSMSTMRHHVVGTSRIDPAAPLLPAYASLLSNASAITSGRHVHHVHDVANLTERQVKRLMRGKNAHTSGENGEEESESEHEEDGEEEELGFERSMDEIKTENVSTVPVVETPVAATTSVTSSTTSKRKHSAPLNGINKPRKLKSRERIIPAASTVDTTSSSGVNKLDKQQQLPPPRSISPSKQHPPVRSKSPVKLQTTTTHSTAAVPLKPMLTKQLSRGSLAPLAATPSSVISSAQRAPSPMRKKQHLNPAAVAMMDTGASPLTHLTATTTIVATNKATTKFLHAVSSSTSAGSPSLKSSASTPSLLRKNTAVLQTLQHSPSNPKLRPVVRTMVVQQQPTNDAKEERMEEKEAMPTISAAPPILSQPLRKTLSPLTTSTPMDMPKLQLQLVK